jgi:hypothetical protein
MRTKGIGTQSRAKRPNTVDAHRGFRAVYILLANIYREKGLVSGTLSVQPSGLAYRERSTKYAM